MFNKISLLLARILDRILSMTSVVKIRNKRASKNALVSYVKTPPYFFPFYFKSIHNNRYQSFVLIKYLESLGYNVYLHDYTDEAAVDYSIQYDLFIGHNITFHEIAGKLRGTVKNILLASGSSPEFGNEQQRKRIQELNERKNSRLMVYDENIVPDLSKNYKTADIILLFGNEFVRRTYPAVFREKSRLINNLTLHPFFTPRKRARNNNFLFISSVGQVHRGLDLLLDIFVSLKNKLYVLSAFEKEKEFVELYRDELYNVPTIRSMGHVDLNSGFFKQIVEDVDFVILPSCSEGQSSSMVNMMAYGLIPVIPENVGIPDSGKVGIVIRTIDLPGVQAAIQEAIQLSDESFLEKRAQLESVHNQYTDVGFRSRLTEILRDQI